MAPEPVGTQLKIEGMWDDYDEDKAQFPQRISVADLAKCSGKTVALDTETTGLQWWSDRMIGLGVWCPEAEVYGYIPALSDERIQEVRDAVLALAPDTVIRMHNAKFDFHFLGIDPGGFVVEDTTNMIHLYDSRMKKAMKTAETIFLGTESKRNHLFKAPKGKMIWDWPIPVAADYCVNDTMVTYDLAEELMPKLQALDLVKLFRKEMAYLVWVWRSERRGFLMDQEYMQKGLERFAADKAKAEALLFKEIGYKFKWTSPQKLSKALYEDYGWDRPVNPFLDADGVDRTRFGQGGGKYNETLTDSFILMEKAKHPLGELVLHLRETAKMENYLTKYFELLDDEGVIHANFNLNGTRTGRLSCGKPNLQNVPSEIRNRETQTAFSGSTDHRVEEYNLRLAFLARPGYKLVSIDYKQMEMRMFGLLAGEEGMMDALRSGEDIHASVAEVVYGSRDPVRREWAKTVGFGLIYGMLKASLAHKLNETEERAQQIAQQYWDRFPRILPWRKETIRECQHYGFIRYWSGRIWREENDNFMYKGANALIQGGCADLLSVAAIRCGSFLQGKDAHIVSYVHDELIFEIKEELVAELIPQLVDIIEVKDLFGIPFFTDVKVGPSYGKLEKWYEEDPRT